MPSKDPTRTSKRKLLLFSFVFLLLCACVFSGMGYYYLTYRNTLMQNAVVKSGIMSVWMVAQDLERNILSLENKLIFDVVATPQNGLDRKTLSEISKRHPIVDNLFFHIQQQKQWKEKGKVQDFEDWLMQKVETDSGQHLHEPLTLRHFSGIYKERPVQAGCIALPPSSTRANPGYLLFTLDLEYIRNQVLPGQKRPANQSLFDVVILEKNSLPESDPVTGDALFVEAPFQDILPFWKIAALIDTSGMNKRAGMEFVVYSGIIFMVLILILLSIFFIWRQMDQERGLSMVKSQMIFHASHELKTPLALIRMYSETLMLGRIVREEKIQEYYQIILGECDRLHLLINNTLDFSSIEKGMKEYNFSLGNIVETVQDLMASYRYYLKQHGFMLHVDIDHNIPSFSFDKVAMQQIIGNLLDNAMKFSPKKKSIQVTLQRKQDNVVLKVIDQGIGMQADALEEIFVPYHRLSERFRGSGIGLSLVKHAVEAHHGTIRVRSREGQGTTFVLAFPLTGESNVV